MQYVTAGESHGPCLTAIITGIPAGLSISLKNIDSDLRRRQAGYGRGGRQTIEKDSAEITSGVRFGVTTGAPIALTVTNRDWDNWQRKMVHFGKPPKDMAREVTPRPGHADLVGALRSNTDDCRNILERSSARETAARVACGGVAKEFLGALGIEVLSYVTSIGSAHMAEEDPAAAAASYEPVAIEFSQVRCPDEEASQRMMAQIDAAKRNGLSLGGKFRVVARGLVPGLGTYVTGSERLTSKIGAALFSIPAIKGVEFGMGFRAAELTGDGVHDPILLKDGEYTRASNNAGGLEGGMTTGLPLIVTCAMKPIPTMMTPLETVNMDTLEVAEASRERSDVCAVPAAAVVAEAEMAMVLADAYTKMFGDTCMADIRANISHYKERLETMSR